MKMFILALAIVTIIAAVAIGQYADSGPLSAVLDSIPALPFDLDFIGIVEALS